MTTEQEMGFGLWQIEDGEGLRREIRDLKSFRETIGDALLIGFAQLFNVTGRLPILGSSSSFRGAPGAPIQHAPCETDFTVPSSGGACLRASQSRWPLLPVRATPVNPWPTLAHSPAQTLPLFV